MNRTFRSHLCAPCVYAGKNDRLTRCLHPEAGESLGVEFNLLAARDPDHDFPARFDMLSLDDCTGFEAVEQRA